MKMGGIGFSGPSHLLSQPLVVLCDIALCCLNPHSQTDQIVGLDPHQVPGARHLDSSGHPTPSNHDIKALAAMQSTIVVVKVEADVDTIHLLIVDQYAAVLSCMHIASLLISFGHIVFFKLLLGNPFRKFKDAGGVQF